MRRSTSSLKIITSLTALGALCVPAYVFGLETGGWREGVQRDIPAALDAAMQQGGRVLVCFSSDPVADDSAVAQLLAAREIRDWVTRRLEGLLQRLEHRDPRATAEQLMMVRTGAVVSRALDENDHLDQDFLTCWEKLVDDGLRAQ